MTCCAVYFHDAKTEPEFVNVFKELKNRFKESIPSAYVAWRLESLPGLLKRLQILAQVRMKQNMASFSGTVNDDGLVMLLGDFLTRYRTKIRQNARIKLQIVRDQGGLF